MLVLVLLLLLLLGSPRIRRDTVSVAVQLRLEGFGPSRGKTIIRIFAGGLPLLLKIMPVVGRMAEAVPACNVAVWALAKALLVSRESISKRVFLWC